jgi:hypothetical protein
MERQRQRQSAGFDQSGAPAGASGNRPSTEGQCSFACHTPRVPRCWVGCPTLRRALQTGQSPPTASVSVAPWVMAPPNNLSTVTRRLCREPLLPLERLAPRSPNSERLPWSDRDRGSRRASLVLVIGNAAIVRVFVDGRRASARSPVILRGSLGAGSVARRSGGRSRLTRTRDRVRFRQSEPFTLGSGYHADNSYHSIRRD